MLSQYPEQVSSYVVYLTLVLIITMELNVQSLVVLRLLVENEGNYK
jgi:hypothetical protein